MLVLFPPSVPAHFRNSFSAETIRKGEGFKIVCEAFGEGPVTLSWSKDRIPFQPAKEARYRLTEQTGQQRGLVGGSDSRSAADGVDDHQQQLSKKDDVRPTLGRLGALQSLKQHSQSYINILEINQTDRRDSALFTCIASNLYGKDEYNVQIIVQGKNFIENRMLLGRTERLLRKRLLEKILGVLISFHRVQHDHCCS